MRVPQLSEAGHQQVLRTLLLVRHSLVTLDRAEIHQDAPPWKLDTHHEIREIDRALAALGWKPGDPMPPGIPFESHA